MANFAKEAVQEFKKMPKGGKIAIIAIFVAVAAFGLYSYYKNRQSVSGTASPSTDTTGTNTGFPMVPGGSAGNVPILPSGYNPIFDPGGNRIGFQPGNPTTPTATTPTGVNSIFTLPTGTPTNFRTDEQGRSTIWYGPRGKGHHSLQHLFPTGTNFRESGTQLFYTLPGGTEQLFPYAITVSPNKRSGNPPKAKQPSSTGSTGGGPDSGMMDHKLWSPEMPPTRYTPKTLVFQRYETQPNGIMLIRKYKLGNS